jgi:hypothetical protein
MVTTGITWFAGVVLVAASVSRARFAHTYGAVTHLQAEPTADGARPGPGHEAALVRACRVLALALGGLCLVLAALGTVSLAR